MGEFERSGLGAKRGVVWAIEDVFTIANFEIAATGALIGYVLFAFIPLLGVTLHFLGPASSPERL